MSVLSIYKKGQGTYVRWGTVIGIGILVLLGVHWIWNTFMPTAPAPLRLVVGLGIVVLGAWLCFWLVNKPNFADFMILSESEMRKVVWPTPAGVFRSTRLVIMLTLGMALMLFMVDGGFVQLFKWMHVIQ